jgi:hypothetical protein
VGKTARIPRDAVVMRIPLVDGREDRRALAVAGALQRTLLDVDHDRATAGELREAIGYDGWIAGDDRRYDAIRKVLARFGHYSFGSADGAEARAADG